MPVHATPPADQDLAPLTSSGDASSASHYEHMRLRRRTADAAIIVMVLLLAAVTGYVVSQVVGLRSLRSASQHRLDLLAEAIDNEVTRVTHLPGVVALNGDIMELLRRPPGQRGRYQQAANRYLERLSAQHVDSLAVFVMDTHGKVLASSDWIYTDNLIGADLSYRSFFTVALGGAPYRQFAVDAVRDEPGYFFAQPIRDQKQDWKIVGVAVLKASIRGVERRWLANDAPALVADENGVVLLAAPPDWHYATLQPLSGERLRQLVRQQFAGHDVGTVSLGIDRRKTERGQTVTLARNLALPAEIDQNGRSFLVMSRALPGTAWQLMVFSNLAPLRAQAMGHGALATAAAGCLILWVLYLRQRRRVLQARLATQTLLEAANRELEQKVAARTADLSQAVTHLEAEVAERERAEQTLRAAQDELVQAAKLAVLGRLAAGITHELSQPLGAMRTLAANAVTFMQRGDLATASSNLDIVGRQIDQMARIIGPLKSFARKSPARAEPVDLAHAIASALFLFEQRLHQQNVSVEQTVSAGSAIALCDANRLEQVLVNLIGNALDALKGQADGHLLFRAERHGERLHLLLLDNGPGLAPEVLLHLFEPFYTTKPAGDGLGLGLAISHDIVRDFGGELRAANRGDLLENSGDAYSSGALFILDLPAAKPDNNGATAAAAAPAAH